MAQKLVYDEKTKKFVPAGGAGAVRETRVKVTIPESLASQIRACADEDGVEYSSSKAKATNVTGMYVEQAVKEFLSKREAVSEAS